MRHHHLRSAKEGHSARRRQPCPAASCGGCAACSSWIGRSRELLMPPSQLPLWVQYTQALGAPLLALVIAAVGAWVACQQVKIARAKLQHDLYDKRFAVFQAARQLLAEVMTHAGVTDDQIRSYVVGTADAVFLLNDDISKYLRELREQAIVLQTISETLAPLPVGDERTGWANAKARTLTGLMEQLDVLVEKFKPFLTIERHEGSRFSRYADRVRAKPHSLKFGKVAMKCSLRFHKRNLGG